MNTMQWSRLLNCNRLREPRILGIDPARSPWQFDYDRIVFSTAFRRMQDKTQVFPLSGGGDYVRTRLAHSLEVSTVARTLGMEAARTILKEHGDEPIPFGSSAEPVETVLWETLVLGDRRSMLSGITPEVADWITDLRVSGLEVKLSPQTELAVQANSTRTAKLAEPTEIGFNLGGFDGMFFVKPILCPFCGDQVGKLVNPMAATLEEQWQHTPCPHVIAVTNNGQSVLKIHGVTEQRSTALGRVRIKAYTVGNEMVYEFSPVQFQPAN